MSHVHTATALVAGALATYRLTRLVTTDVVTEPLRNRVWETHPPESSKIGYLITCDHCVSIYAGGAVSALAFVAAHPLARRHLAHVPAMFAIGTLALSGATSLYHEHLERQRERDSFR
jgi:hypothetical protein